MFTMCPYVVGLIKFNEKKDLLMIILARKIANLREYFIGYLTLKMTPKTYNYTPIE